MNNGPFLEKWHISDILEQVTIKQTNKKYEVSVKTWKFYSNCLEGQISISEGKADYCLWPFQRIPYS